MIILFSKLVKCANPNCFNVPSKSYKMCDACMRAEFVRLRLKK